MSDPEAVISPGPEPGSGPVPVSVKESERAVCGLVSRRACQQRLSARFCAGRMAKRVLLQAARRHCAVCQCAYERGLVSCAECVESPCGFHQRYRQICPVADRIRTRRKPQVGAYPPEADHQAIAPGDLPRATVPRIQWYQRVLEQMMVEGVRTASSDDLARRTGVKPSLVRKDLSRFGRLGTPSLGYNVPALRRRLAAAMGMDHMRPVVWMGARRLMAHPDLFAQFQACSCEIVAVLDPDPALHGLPVEGLVVMPPGHVATLVANGGVELAVLDLPDRLAQQGAEALIAAGVRRLLNYSRVPLQVPAGVRVQQADLATQLLLLSSQ